MNRRLFLKGAATAAAALPLTAFMQRAEAWPGPNPRRSDAAGYGPLAPALDQATGLPLLSLPAGFSYVSFGWRGDLLANGTATPGGHDGMAAFRAGGHRVRLVRNHELGRGVTFTTPYYDAQAAGGTTTLEFDTRDGVFIEANPSLGGTLRNCAGGPTPWGRWLSCEEATEFTTMPHGYVFDVPADGVGDPMPIRDMGRFSHEAVAIDPVTGYIYETEDAGSSSGFYRYVPHKRNRPADGGELFMMKISGIDGVNLGLSYAPGTAFDVEWVRIDNPDSFSPTMPGNFVWAQGACTFARMEGCWFGNERRIYIVSTSGGIGQGQVWDYDPHQERISLLFQSPGAAVLNAPDNITVSPRGGLVLCEDGSGEEFVHGLTVDGEIFPFAKNTVVLNGERNGLMGDRRGSEFAGACYSPDGDWLFVNIQDPGITFAITGPWQAGAL